MNLFEIMNNIFEKTGGFLPKEALTSYSNFMSNRALSQYQETIFFANELNGLSLEKDQHYAFLFHAITKKKRFAKWNKNEDPKSDIELIQEYYGYSYHKAKEVLPLLKNKMEFIKNELAKGGKKKYKSFINKIVL